MRDMSDHRVNGRVIHNGGGQHYFTWFWGGNKFFISNLVSGGGHCFEKKMYVFFIVREGDKNILRGCVCRFFFGGDSSFWLKQGCDFHLIHLKSIKVIFCPLLSIIFNLSIIFVHLLSIVHYFVHFFFKC